MAKTTKVKPELFKATCASHMCTHCKKNLTSITWRSWVVAIIAYSIFALAMVFLVAITDSSPQCFVRTVVNYPDEHSTLYKDVDVSCE